MANYVVCFGNGEKSQMVAIKGEDLTGAKTAIGQAVLGGGGWVKLDTPGGGSLHLLVSSGVPVWIREEADPQFIFD